MTRVAGSLTFPTDPPAIDGRGYGVQTDSPRDAWQRRPALFGCGPRLSSVEGRTPEPCGGGAFFFDGCCQVTPATLVTATLFDEAAIESAWRCTNLTLL